MKKGDLLFYTDAAALVLFVFLAATGTLIYLVLPPGLGHASQVWGLSRHEWGTIHFWGTLTFITLMGVHLSLHWSWIKKRVAGPRGEFSLHNIRVRLAFYALLATLLFLAKLFLSTPKRSETSGNGPFLTAVSSEQ